MSTQEESNKRYNTNEYKTKKLVLRRIKAGTYQIGDPISTGRMVQAPNTKHQVVVTKDYFAAVFETTNGQYRRIMNDTTYSDNAYPVVRLSYNMVRGNASVGALPGYGVCSNMNAKTSKIGWDLPTESMWEVAARAGNLEQWASGASAAKLNEYANWHSSGTLPVGSLKPNNWGLFDTSGNTWEFARDNSRNGGADLKSFTAQNADVFVPITGADNSKECLCGGSYLSSDPQSYTLISARYLNHSKNDGRDHMGHRLFYVPQD